MHTCTYYCRHGHRHTHSCTCQRKRLATMSQGPCVASSHPPLTTRCPTAPCSHKHLRTHHVHGHCIRARRLAGEAMLPAHGNDGSISSRRLPNPLGRLRRHLRTCEGQRRGCKWDGAPAGARQQNGADNGESHVLSLRLATDHGLQEEGSLGGRDIAAEYVVACATSHAYGSGDVYQPTAWTKTQVAARVCSDTRGKTKRRQGLRRGSLTTRQAR